MAYAFNDDKSKMMIKSLTGSRTVPANSELSFLVTNTEINHRDINDIYILSIMQCIVPTSSSNRNREWTNTNGIMLSSGESYPRAEISGFSSIVLSGETQKFRIKLYNNTNESKTVEYKLLYALMS